MNGLAAYAKALIEIYGDGNFGYVYGSQGEVITEQGLLRLKYKYGYVAPGGPEYYDSERVRKWLGYPCADCSGLVMYFMQKLNVYTYDKSADMLYEESEYVSQPQEGDLTFRLVNDKATHIGIYIADGSVIHSKGTDFGVVKNIEKWDSLGRIKIPDIHWAEPYYQFLLEKGIMYSDRKFDDYMTRGEYFAAKAKEHRS